MVVIAIIFIVLIVSKLSYTFSKVSWPLSDFAWCINAGVSMLVHQCVSMQAATLFICVIDVFIAEYFGFLASSKCYTKTFIYLLFII